MADPQSNTWPPSSFLKAWDDYVSASQVMFERLKDPAANGSGGISLPFFGAWQEFAKSLGMSSDFVPSASFKPEDMIANVAPALGLTREYQGIVQRMLELGAQFQRSYTEFLRQSADISEQALQTVQKRAAADPSLNSSAAAAYEAWIESAETAYHQAAHGEAFSRSLGELCNLLSAFKVERGKLLEALARHLDLPSRAEVDSLHRQVHDLTSAVRGASSRPSPRQPSARKSRKPGGK
jgi:class III poly(R)-hydroxyalkanoic acid synthase PhaE subunit